MDSTRPPLRETFSRPSLRTLAVLTLVAVCVGLVAWGVLQATRVAHGLGLRRDAALAVRSDGAEAAGNAGDAFRSFGSTLHPGERFALLFSTDTSVDDRGTYRLVALSYLYPAVGVDDVSAAQAVMVFGEPSPAVRSSFEETGVVDGVWLGRRP